MTTSGLSRAVDAAGSQTALAKLLQVSPQAVSAWIARGYAPPSRLREIEASTGVALRELLLDLETTITAKAA